MSMKKLRNVLEGEGEPQKKKRQKNLRGKNVFDEKELLFRFAKTDELEKKEKEFQFQQIKLRAEIRLRQGRPKPIDKLFMHIHRRQPNHNLLLHREEINVVEPYLLFKGLTVKEIEQLYDNIKLVIELETDNRIIQYWEAILVICEWEIGFEGLKHQAEKRGLLHSSIETDVKSLLQLKTYVELEELQTDIESQMRSGAAKVVEYWEAVLKHLHFYKAKAFLKETRGTEDEQHDGRSDAVEALSVEESTLCKDNLEATAGARFHHSPKQHITMLEEQEGLSGCDVVNLDSEVYWWHDKYRPRKPKYYTRVHTGYHWNRYNRVHYDYDHPPPKMVQGYKFTILYPDLVQKSKAPVFTTQKDGKSADTCILRFHAGPPYEDIAFKIVNKEWEYSRKRGFKCTFDGHILQLDFNFKRCSYRR